MSLSVARVWIFDSNETPRWK